MAAHHGVTMGSVRETLLFIISVAMIVVGFGMAAFGLLNLPIFSLAIAGAAMLAFVGIYLLWKDFIAPLFARR